MEITYLICVVTATIAIVFFVVEASLTLVQMRRTAFKVERLAGNIDRRINTIDELTEAAKVIASGMSNSWIKFIKGVSGFFGRRKNDENRCDL